MANQTVAPFRRLTSLRSISCAGSIVSVYLTYFYSLYTFNEYVCVWASACLLDGLVCRQINAPKWCMEPGNLCTRAANRPTDQPSSPLLHTRLHIYVLMHPPFFTLPSRLCISLYFSHIRNAYKWIYIHYCHEEPKKKWEMSSKHRCVDSSCFCCVCVCMTLVVILFEMLGYLLMFDNCWTSPLICLCSISLWTALRATFCLGLYVCTIIPVAAFKVFFNLLFSASRYLIKLIIVMLLMQFVVFWHLMEQPL